MEAYGCEPNNFSSHETDTRDHKHADSQDPFLIQEELALPRELSSPEEVLVAQDHLNRHQASPVPFSSSQPPLPPPISQHRSFLLLPVWLPSLL